MHSVIVTIFRATLGFLVLLILTRILGKKQIGQITLFTYITGVSMGNIAGDMVVHKDIKLIDGIAALVVWAVFTFIIEYISLKSPKARTVLDGEPSIVIKKGVIMQDELASQKLNMDDLTMLLRINNVFSIQDVDYAILEPNGQLSVLKKPELDTITKKDMQIQPANRSYIPSEIIVDGKIVTKNLKELNLDNNWLNLKLKEANINSSDEVFFAELQVDGSLHINRKM